VLTQFARLSAHAFGATSDVSDVCVRCWCHFEELTTHASGMDWTRPVCPSSESGAMVSGEYLLATTDSFQTVKSTGRWSGQHRTRSV